MSRLSRATAAFAVMTAICLSPGAANAGWRDDLGTFRIGLLPDPGMGRAVAGLSEISNAFSAALDMPVQVFVARDYAALIDAHATSRIEYAVYSATAFATASRLCSCVEPLVAPRGSDSEIGVRSVLLVRRSALEGRTLGDIRVAVSQGDGLASALLPGMALAGKDGPSGLGSGQLVMAASESDAETMFVDGKVDGLFGWSVVLDGADEESASGGTMARLIDQGMEAQQLMVSWMSGPLRHGPHAVRSDLDDEAKEILGDFLTGLDKKKPDILELLTGSVEGQLVSVNSDDYQLAFKIVDRISEK